MRVGWEERWRGEVIEVGGRNKPLAVFSAHYYTILLQLRCLGESASHGAACCRIRGHA